MFSEFFKHIAFAYPWVLALLPLIPLWFVLNRKRQAGGKANMIMSNSNQLPLSNWKTRWMGIPRILRALGMAGIILALARPQELFSTRYTEGEGIDIVLCLDVSGSMTAQDFTPNRLEASRLMASRFVEKRTADRIGLVVFAGESFTLSPVTTDHNMLLNALQGIRGGLLEDGTAIGSGLAASVDRLRTGNAKSKIILLLTDGENNGGLVDPLTALDIAIQYGIKIYTIGIGTDGYARQPVNTPAGVVIQQEKVSIDEKLLTKMAKESGGAYFRAKDNEGLDAVYSNIDRLEKSNVQIKTREKKVERFQPFLLFAFICIVLEWVLRFTIFRKFP